MTMEGIADFTTTNFTHRCRVLEYNQSVFDYIRRFCADYLIIDCADARKPVARLSGNQYLSFGIFIQQNKAKFESRYGKIEAIYPHSHWSDEEWSACANWYCDRILEMYTPDNIVLHEVLNVENWRGRDNSWQSFSPEKRKTDSESNARIKKVNEVFAERLSGRHIIRQPENVFADAGTGSVWILFTSTLFITSTL